MFAALTPILQNAFNTSLQALGEHQKLRRYALVGVNQFLINMCHAIYLYTDVPMCIPIGNTICLLLQFFRQFLLHCFMDSALRHLLQNTIDILRSVLISAAAVLTIRGDTAFTFPFR